MEKHEQKQGEKRLGNSADNHVQNVMAGAVCGARSSTAARPAREQSPNAKTERAGNLRPSVKVQPANGECSGASTEATDDQRSNATPESAQDRRPIAAPRHIDGRRTGAAAKITVTEIPTRLKIKPRPAPRLAGTPGLGGIYGLGIVRPQRGSAIVISHESALAFWRRVRVEDPVWTRELLGQLYPDNLLAGLTTESLAADTSLRPLELPASPLEYAHHAAKVLGLREPVDVVVGKPASRKHSHILRCHVWSGPISDGLLANVGQNVFICSPELVIAQLASKLELYKTAMLEMELCGSYAPLENGTCEWGALPLTNTARVAKVIGLSEPTWGLSIARKAASYSMDSSASPRESVLALMLSLPRKMGGLGCGKPLLNTKIELSDTAARECSRSYLVADLLFESADLDIEYQGKEWHTRQEDRLSDEARQNALMMMGKTCLFISNEQITDQDRMDGLANLIRSRMGLRPFRGELSWRAMQNRARLEEDLALR